MKKNIQVSESMELGIMLALSGGFMDAYSYLERGKVFANAQTGNMLLLGVHLSEGDFSLAIRYFFPILAFGIGIALADCIRMKGISRLHWRQISVLIEAFVLLGVSFLPQSLNLAANSLTSLACGIQVESFRKIHGNGVATTMCIGNLRSGTENLCTYVHTKNRQHLHNGLLYYGIIFFFVLGAVIGNYLILLFAEKAILGSSIILIAAFFLMFIDHEKERVHKHF
ncbi:MAG: YoaK family protein [Lachnospiraceae bacterium]|nr:YoaK family protein [Lachnospiraceae bacterium]